LLKRFTGRKRARLAVSVILNYEAASTFIPVILSTTRSIFWDVNFGNVDADDSYLRVHARLAHLRQPG
jgi:hypothetical protein